jgi:hypothetical protein
MGQVHLVTPPAAQMAQMYSSIPKEISLQERFSLLEAAAEEIQLTPPKMVDLAGLSHLAQVTTY